MLVKVLVRDGNLAQALKVFKKKVNRSGHIEELKRRREYLNPSTIKHANNQDIAFTKKKKKKNPNIY